MSYGVASCGRAGVPKPEAFGPRRATDSMDRQIRTATVDCIIPSRAFSRHWESLSERETTISSLTARFRRRYRVNSTWSLSDMDFQSKRRSFLPPICVQLERMRASTFMTAMRLMIIMASFQKNVFFFFNS